MTDFDPSTSDTAPLNLVGNPEPQQHVPATVTEPEVVVVKHEVPDTAAKSTIQAAVPQQQLANPAQIPPHAAPQFQQNLLQRTPVLSSPAYPFNYTPITAKEPTLDIASDDADSPSQPTMGLTGIRIFLATFAILLLCGISAGAGYLGAQSYYKPHIGMVMSQLMGENLSELMESRGPGSTRLAADKEPALTTEGKSEGELVQG